MRIVYRGNFQVDFTTESHIGATLEALGHTVIRHQEDAISWNKTLASCAVSDLFLWTSTFSMAHIHDQADAHDAVRTLKDTLPTAAIHLDRFFDLSREAQLDTEPWFGLDHVFTADGGNQDRFAAHGINHHWSPPAVYGPECVLGVPSPRFTSEIAFVGSWRGHYHRESRHRFALISFLRRRYRNRVKFWPGREAIRGQALNDLYASVKVIVGDSCLVGTGKESFYWSDRVAETTGRGGFLIHPFVRGLDDVHPDLVTWQSGDWRRLGNLIDEYLADADRREDLRLTNHLHTRAHHTYAHRLERVLSIVSGRPDEQHQDGADHDQQPLVDPAAAPSPRAVG